LGQAGITAISLAYEKSNWTDTFGNQFRNKAKIVRSGGTKANGKGQGAGGGSDQWIYDVVLVGGSLK